MRDCTDVSGQRALTVASEPQARKAGAECRRAVRTNAGSEAGSTRTGAGVVDHYADGRKDPAPVLGQGTNR